jgi:hypothetical protein
VPPQEEEPALERYVGPPHIVFGHNAALACHMANEAYFRRTTVTWDEASKTIKG